MLIDIVRHGECADSAFLRGRCDSPLTALGEQQMRQALSDVVPADLVFSAPAQRNLHFARAHYPDVQVLEAFAERDFGDWDGLSFQAVQQTDAERLELYLQNPFADVIPNSESLVDFEKRIAAGWLYLCGLPVESILLFSHSGVQRVLLKKILGFPNKSLFNLKIGYAARIRLDVQKTSQGYFTQLVEIAQVKLS
ncbi:phosphoglycerate mutase [Thiosulfatimonas sediminis]|uniref:Phosphoglycerate mutase n=1 Tax=Thiosulfatimonas sediminis TaxID=2675054 RepID=A0A6F8PVG5_9GAMM|nr:phosphoglycerate mutase [Thiosulfatimonas sediminis]